MTRQCLLTRSRQCQKRRDGMSRAELTSVTRLLAAEAALTALVFLEWLAVRPGEAVGEKRGSLTEPSAVLLTAERAGGA